MVLLAALVVGTLNPDFFRTFYQEVEQGIAQIRSRSRWIDGKTARPSSRTHRNLVADTFSFSASPSQKVLQGQSGRLENALPSGRHRVDCRLRTCRQVSADSGLSRHRCRRRPWRTGGGKPPSRQASSARPGCCSIALGFVSETAETAMESVFRAHLSGRRTAKYRILAENATDLVTLKPGFSGARSYVSPSARSMVGWEPEELRVLSIEDFIHPDDIERVACGIRRARPGTPSCFEPASEFGARMAATIWLDSVFRLTNSGDVIVAGRDVTSRRAVEQSLAESESRYRLLADHSSDLIVLEDHIRWRPLLCLPVLRIPIVGYDPDEFAIHPRIRCHPSRRL